MFAQWFRTNWCKHFNIQNKYQIYLEPRYCSCQYFIDEGTCKHHVGACIITNHVDNNNREFVMATGRGRPKSAKGALKK